MYMYIQALGYFTVDSFLHNAKVHMCIVHTHVHVHVHTYMYVHTYNVRFALPWEAYRVFALAAIFTSLLVPTLSATECEAEQAYMEVKENPAYGQSIQSQAHEYEIPSVNLGHFSDPPDQTQAETYEIMLRQQSSEYVAMDTHIAETDVDYPIYEELN